MQARNLNRLFLAQPFGRSLFAMNQARMMSVQLGTTAPPKKNLGRSKFNFNDIKYNKGPNYGHSAQTNRDKVFLDFTPSTVWDNPGARR